MSEELEPEVFSEVLDVVRALRAHVEYLAISGGVGVPRADVPIGPSLTEPPASMMPAAVPNEARRAAEHARSLGVPAGSLQQPEIPAWLASAATPNARVPQPSGTSMAGAQHVPSTVAANSISALSKEERQKRLVVLENEIRGCLRCALAAKRTQTVFSRGTGSSGLCFVGEGPGADEDAEGAPFVGAAGQLLDRMIAAMGLGREEVYVCNIVKCRPPDNRKPEPLEMRSCMPYLEEQLELLAPDVIVALGATAVEGLLGISGGITRLRGTWKLYKGRIAVMPTFHPAYLLRAPSAKHVVWEDMQAVLKHLGRPVPQRGKRT